MGLNREAKLDTRFTQMVYAVTVETQNPHADLIKITDLTRLAIKDGCSVPAIIGYDENVNNIVLYEEILQGSKIYYGDNCHLTAVKNYSGIEKEVIDYPSMMNYNMEKSKDLQKLDVKAYCDLVNNISKLTKQYGVSLDLINMENIVLENHYSLGGQQKFHIKNIDYKKLIEGNSEKLKKINYSKTATLKDLINQNTNPKLVDIAKNNQTSDCQVALKLLDIFIGYGMMNNENGNPVVDRDEYLRCMRIGSRQIFTKLTEAFNKCELNFSKHDVSVLQNKMKQYVIDQEVVPELSAK